MNTYHVVLVGLVALAVGSFLNVVIYRLPRGIMWRSSRSICPSCGEKLRWYHNVPVISYAVLVGRCGYCARRISLRYPLVELLNVALWLLVLYLLGPGWQFAGFSLLMSGLIAVFFIDLDHQIIPDSITLPGLVVGLALSLAPGGIGIVQSGIGVLAGGLGLLLVAMAGDWLFKKESLGGGDIKMAAMLGAFLGWQKLMFVFIAAAFIGVVVSVIWMTISARVRSTRMIPFGPFLAAAAVVAMTWGDTIIKYYKTNFLGLG